MKRIFRNLLILCLMASAAACEKGVFSSQTVTPSALRDVPALRLNFRYEADVPAPAINAAKNSIEERNQAVQADFDAVRTQEILARTIASPNGQRVLAVYQRLGDPEATYRLDMYGADGRLIRRVSPDSMAVDFPDIIVWSPDSTTVAFVAIAREGGLNSLVPLPVTNSNSNSNGAVPGSSPASSNSNTNANTEQVSTPVPPPPTGDSPPNVITFRTEQIYICNSEGLDLKPITQNEGLIYYFLVWSPNSAMLACLAATAQEWRYLQMQADRANEVFVPIGRPRIVEKNGRERRLDDSLTGVHPAWSPDSAKLAVGYLTQQIRIYDAVGDQPTQAAIPIRNSLLFSSQAYDQRVNAEQNTQLAPDANTNPAPNPAAPSSTLPDESTLVSFQPTIALEWPLDGELYFQTGFVKQYKTGDGARSSLRWHRLILSPQPTALK